MSTVLPVMGWRGQPIPGVRVIGVCGAARAGKDALARYLIELVPGAERFAFSDGVAALARANGVMRRRDPLRLQEVGMAVRRLARGTWLDILYGAIDDKRPPLAVITGVRFDDEAALVRTMGGKLVKVVRLEPDGLPYVATDRDPRHAAEADIAGLRPDVEVRLASGDLDGLRAFAETLV